MAKKNHIPFLLTALCLLVNTNTVSAEEVIFIEGREVLLNDDGSWKYLSTDRYANTKNGSRIRLKEDGSWQAVGNAPSISKKQVRTNTLDVKLQKVVIETYKKKAQKNTKIKTQTVFYLNITTSPQAKANTSIKKDDISLIEVKDNNGKNYPVLSLKPDTMQLKPNNTATIVIRAEKSPSIWDNVKSMQITLKSGILGIEKPITFSQRTIDFDAVSVDGF